MTIQSWLFLFFAVLFVFSDGVWFQFKIGHVCHLYKGDQLFKVGLFQSSPEKSDGGSGADETKYVPVTDYIV